MTKPDEIKDVLKKHKRELRKRFKVKNVGVFGSYIKEQQRKRSNIDIVVEFEEPVGLFEFMRLEEHLSNLLGAKVDFVSKKALKPKIGGHIPKEVVYV